MTVHNRINNLRVFLSSNISEYQVLFEKKQFEALKELHELSDHHRIIGYKNDDGEWIPRTLISYQEVESSDFAYILDRNEEIFPNYNPLRNKGKFQEFMYKYVECIVKEIEERIIRTVKNL